MEIKKISDATVKPSTIAIAICWLQVFEPYFLGEWYLQKSVREGLIGWSNQIYLESEVFPSGNSLYTGKICEDVVFGHHCLPPYLVN